jgi:hypothetical protein
MSSNPQLNNGFRARSSVTTRAYEDGGALIHLMKAETFFMNNRDYPSKARNSLLDNAFAVTQTTGGVSL